MRYGRQIIARFLHVNPSGILRVFLLPLLVAAGADTRALGAIRYVRPDGADGNSGLAWGSAKRSVAAALVQAQPGDEVWVAAGTYVERISLPREVALYGGFVGVETRRDQRDWLLNPTILDGAQGGPVVRSEAVGATPATRLDGFTVRNGRGILGGGIACTATSPTLANNLITGNVSAGPGGGICCYNGANPRILNNRILENLAGGEEGDGGGIACMKGGSKENLGSSPLIVGNLIARNRAEENGGGIVAKGIFVSDDGQVVVPSAPVILNNFITENLATQPPLGDRSLGGGGIACTDDGMAPVIANNTLTANGGLQAGGILLVGGARDNPLVANNTFVGNNGPALRWVGLNSLRLANNLVAFNTAGLTRSTRLPGGAAVITHNLVHGNAVDFDGLADVIGTSGNLGFDPRLASAAYGDSHLQPDSPAVNAGDPTFLAGDWVDMDGAPRVSGGLVDIGADEADGLRRTIFPLVIRVSPTGNDNRDGATWATAKRTVGAAIAALHTPALGVNHTIRGGEVWVKAGTYSENLTLPPYVHLYGGFRGQETTRTERDLQANLTQLNGGSQGRVVLVWGGHRLSTVEGFMITGGRLDGDTRRPGGRPGVLPGGAGRRPQPHHGQRGQRRRRDRGLRRQPANLQLRHHQQRGGGRWERVGGGHPPRPIVGAHRGLRHRPQPRLGWRRPLRLVQQTPDRRKRDLREPGQGPLAPQQPRLGLGVGRTPARGGQSHLPEPKLP